MRNGVSLGLYIDGTHAGEGFGLEANGPITTDLRSLGREGRAEAQGKHGPEVYFDGAVDEFCIFNRALEVDEIKRLSGR